MMNSIFSNNNMCNVFPTTAKSTNTNYNNKKELKGPIYISLRKAFLNLELKHYKNKPFTILLFIKYSLLMKKLKGINVIDSIDQIA